MDLSKVTRVTVVSDEGIEFERYNLYKGGIEIHLQDEGRTLKIFPHTQELGTHNQDDPTLTKEQVQHTVDNWYEQTGIPKFDFTQLKGVENA